MDPGPRAVTRSVHVCSDPQHSACHADGTFNFYSTRPVTALRGLFLLPTRRTSTASHLHPVTLHSPHSQIRLRLPETSTESGGVEMQGHSVSAGSGHGFIPGLDKQTDICKKKRRRRKQLLQRLQTAHLKRPERTHIHTYTHSHPHVRKQPLPFRVDHAHK